MRSVREPKPINWENQKLNKIQDRLEEKCEVVYQTELEEKCENEEEKLCREIVRKQCTTVNEEKCETR